MQLDPPVNYSTMLHACTCGSAHELRAYPVPEGFVVAVCCTSCRVKGLPARYSTETDTLPTFDAAEEARKSLLITGRMPTPEPPPKPQPRHVYHRADSNRWIVQVERKGNVFYRSFRSEEEALRARDEFLDAA